jgi:quinol monooxygenase YgiN
MKLPLLLLLLGACTALRPYVANGQITRHTGLLHHEEPAEAALLVSTARLPIKPESRPAFLATEAALAVPVRQEAGCLSYAVYEDPSAPNTFFTVEEWATQAAWEAHCKHPDAATYLKLLPGWLAGPATSQLYQVSHRRVVVTSPATR